MKDNPDNSLPYPSYKNPEYYESENALLLDEFTEEVNAMFFKQGPKRIELEEFIKKQKPLNGAIIISKITDNLKEYVKPFGADFGNKEYGMYYCPIDDLELSPQECNYNNIIKLYKTFTQEHRDECYLIQLQYPCIENPENCKQLIMLSNGLNADLQFSI